MKMRSALIAITLGLFLITIAYGQASGTLLYNSKGQLRADTSLVINNDQLRKWRAIEDFIIEKIIQKVTYSEMALVSNLSGVSIVSFTVDSIGKLKDFRIIKKVGGGLEERIMFCLEEFSYLNHLSNINNNDNRYFLALNFQFIDAEKYIEKEKAIPIYDVKFIYIQN